MAASFYELSPTWGFVSLPGVQGILSYWRACPPRRSSRGELSPRTPPSSLWNFIARSDVTTLRQTTLAGRYCNGWSLDIRINAFVSLQWRFLIHRDAFFIIFPSRRYFHEDFVKASIKYREKLIFKYYCCNSFSLNFFFFIKNIFFSNFIWQFTFMKIDVKIFVILFRKEFILLNF